MTAVDPVRPSDGVGPPRWVSASLDVKEGRDPLGLQTTTQDRLMPRLLPGILELSRRARYFSFHAYLMDKYRELRLREDGNSLSAFIKAREWEFGLAVLLCPHECGSSPVGAQRLRQVVGHQSAPYPRGESVESPFGGYGLYYRSPLAELGIVARAGTMLGDKPITVDVLYDNERARQLADTFREAIEGTDYATSWMLTTDPLPLDVLVEYARVCCLCQLRQRLTERDAVHDALFDKGPASSGSPAIPGPEAEDDTNELQESSSGATLAPDDPVIQRRRSVAHYLTLIAADPNVVDDEGAYREALWSPPALRSPAHEVVAGQWAALIAKDVWQDALCSIWSEFCRSGLDAARSAGTDGLSWDEVRNTAFSMVVGPPALAPDMSTAAVVSAIADGRVSLAGVEGPIPEAPLETLRAATEQLDTATSGAVVLLELYRRAEARTDPGWREFAGLRSAWQPSLMSVFDGLGSHLAEDPDISDTLWWIVHRFIIGTHERIAYSKLPEHTFRFRWEDGQVHFYDNGVGRFPLAAIRNEPLSLLTWDLGFWDRDPQDGAKLTTRGSEFVNEMLP